MGQNVTVIQLQMGFCIRVGGKQIEHFQSIEEGGSKAEALLMKKVLNKDQYDEAKDLLRRLEIRLEEDRAHQLSSALSRGRPRSSGLRAT